MANSYFQFKQFRIEQGQTAMKVTTEACLFGSLIETEKAANILDIGSGTGLLSLMLAQNTEVPIDAVELDPLAYGQNQTNFETSPWHKQLRVHHSTIQSFDSNQQYDLIISNPPFFEKHQAGQKANKNMALHNETLSYQELAESIARLISENGKAWVLLPPHPMQLFEKEMALLGLHPFKGMHIQNRPEQPIFRKVYAFSKKKTEAAITELAIRNQEGQYTQTFIDLLKPYYLHL